MQNQTVGTACGILGRESALLGIWGGSHGVLRRMDGTAIAGVTPGGPQRPLCRPKFIWEGLGGVLYLPCTAVGDGELAQAVIVHAGVREGALLQGASPQQCLQAAAVL